MTEKQKSKWAEKRKLKEIKVKFKASDHFPEKQKTFLTQKEWKEILYESAKEHCYRPHMSRAEVIVMCTEKAIIKKTFPKEDKDKAIYNWRYKCGELEEENAYLKSQLCDYDKLKDELKKRPLAIAEYKNDKWEFDLQDYIPKEKVRKATEDLTVALKSIHDGRDRILNLENIEEIPFKYRRQINWGWKEVHEGHEKIESIIKQLLGEN